MKNFVTVLTVGLILVSLILAFGIRMNKNQIAEQSIQIASLENALDQKIQDEGIRSDENDERLNEAINQLYDDIHPVDLDPGATTAASTMSRQENEPTESIQKSLGLFKIVAYYQGGNGLQTATGVMCKAGRTIAVDPDVIPYGTRVYIEGLGERIAEDCGDFRGNVIDVYYRTKNECLEWGARYREVWVIE